MIPFSFFPNTRNVTYFMPLMVHFWIGICSYLTISKKFPYNIAKNVIDKTFKMRDNLLLSKAKMEIFMLPLQIFFILLGRSNIFFIVFYVNILRIKYMCH